MMELDTLPAFYKRYIERVVHGEMMEALLSSGREATLLFRSLTDSKGNFRYEAGKWSIKEVICHMMDAERIFCYRALRFARNDSTALSGFEENDYASEANADGRSLLQLADEFDRLRSTTNDLFASFTPSMLLRTGTANQIELSVQAIGYIVSGHTLHHLEVLHQRYLK